MNYVQIEEALDVTAQIALSAGYAPAAIAAGKLFYKRNRPIAHPPGQFDRAGRFTADERTKTVTDSRSPSRAYKYPEMEAARTAAHCAEVKGVSEDRVIAVKRIDHAVKLSIKNGNTLDTIAAVEKSLRKKIA